VGRFQSGPNSVANTFPKASAPRNKQIWTPGPGSYEPLQSMGKQKVSTKTDAPIVLFAKAERPSLVPTGMTSIGPAEYEPSPAACEPQIDSRKPTAPNIKFGTGYKKAAARKPNLQEPSPGPGSYNIPGSIATHSKGTPWTNAPVVSISGRNKFGSPW
jgi:Sperm-tail PG-rich repeat